MGVERVNIGVERVNCGLIYIGVESTGLIYGVERVNSEEIGHS